jgi:nucleoid-associated protein YgaU
MMRYPTTFHLSFLNILDHRMIVGGESMAKGTIKTKTYRIKKREEDIDEIDNAEEEEAVSNFKPVFSTLKIIGIVFVIASVFHGVVIKQSWNIPVQAMSLVSGTYTVKQGDNLWLIVQKNYPKENPHTMIREIKEKNHLKNNNVRVGQVLQLP